MPAPPCLYLCDELEYSANTVISSIIAVNDLCL